MKIVNAEARSAAVETPEVRPVKKLEVPSRQFRGEEALRSGRDVEVSLTRQVDGRSVRKRLTVFRRAAKRRALACFTPDSSLAMCGTRLV